MSEGISIHCPHCGNIFSICKKCWRGQRYCSLSCRKTARKNNLKKYQKKYLSTDKGKHSNNVRQKRFKKKQISVTHHSSKVEKHALFFPRIKTKSKENICITCHTSIDSLHSLTSKIKFFSFCRFNH